MQFTIYLRNEMLADPSELKRTNLEIHAYAPTDNLGVRINLFLDLQINA